MSDLDARLRWMAGREEAELVELVELLCRTVPTSTLVWALARKYGVADLADLAATTHRPGPDV